MIITEIYGRHAIELDCDNERPVAICYIYASL